MTIECKQTKIDEILEYFGELANYEAYTGQLANYREYGINYLFYELKSKYSELKELFKESEIYYDDKMMVDYAQKIGILYKLLYEVKSYIYDEDKFEVACYPTNGFDFLIEYDGEMLLMKFSLQTKPNAIEGFQEEYAMLNYYKEKMKIIYGCNVDVYWYPLYVLDEVWTLPKHPERDKLKDVISELRPKIEKCFKQQMDECIEYLIRWFNKKTDPKGQFVFRRN